MLTFLGSPITLFNLTICLVYLVMYLGGPLIIMRLHDETLQDGMPLRRFVKEKFSINTGHITGAQAWFQICLIPAALFITAAGMGLIITFTS